MTVKVKALRSVLGLRPGQVTDVEQTPYLKRLIDAGMVERISKADAAGLETVTLAEPPT